MAPMSLRAGVMKMGSIVPRVAIEATSLTYRASVLTITPHKLPDTTILPTNACPCSSFSERSVQTATFPLDYASTTASRPW